MKTGLVFVCVIQYRLPLIYVAHIIKKLVEQVEKIISMK